MSKTIDAVALVAYVTKTDKADWEAFEGPNVGDGDEFWFNEVGDCGPTAEDVGHMVKQGYVAGKGWSISTKADLQEDDAAAEYIGGLIAEGYTSGYEPTWEVSIDNREPREAYVNVDGDDVTIEIAVPEGFTDYSKRTTIQALQADPDFADFVIDKANEAAPR